VVEDSRNLWNYSTKLARLTDEKFDSHLQNSLA